MSDVLKIKVNLALNPIDATRDINKQIEKIAVDDIKVGLKLDKNKIDLSALNKLDLTEFKRKFKDAFSIEGTVVSDLKDTMSSVERIINARISTANVVKFQSLSKALTELGNSLSIDNKTLNQFEKINDTLTQFNALSKEAQKALLSKGTERKIQGNLDDFSNEVSKKFGVSSTQLAQSVKKGTEDLNTALRDVSKTQLKSATKYLDVQDGIAEVIKQKWNDWTDLTTTTFTDGSQLGKLTSNVEGYLNKIEKQYESVTDKIRKYSVDLHKAISEGEIGDIEAYKSIISDFEALKKKMVEDVGASPFANQLLAEFNRVDALSKKMQDLATSQYDRGVTEKEQKEYLAKVKQYANEVVRLNKEIAQAEKDGLGEHVQRQVADIKKAKQELQKLLNTDIKDIFPDDIKARTELKNRATDIINAMDDANNLYNERLNKKLDESGLSKFVAEYKKNASEIVALENKLSTALDLDQTDYASELQTKITALREEQEQLKNNAKSLALYEKAMKSVAEVEEKSKNNTELHNSYLENKSKIKQQQAEEKAQEQIAKEQDAQVKRQLKAQQESQKQYWEDMLRHQDVISKGYEQVSKTLATKQNEYIQALADDSVGKAEGLRKSIEYWKEQKDNLLREINNGKFTSDFYDDIKGIDTRNNLFIGEFEGALSDKVNKRNEQKENELINIYKKLSKQLSDKENKLLEAVMKDDVDTVNAFQKSVDKYSQDIDNFLKGINFDSFSDRLREEFAKIDLDNGIYRDEFVAKLDDKLRNKLINENEALQKSLLKEYKDISNAVNSKEQELIKAFASDSSESSKAIETSLNSLYEKYEKVISKIRNSGLESVLKAQMDDIDRSNGLKANELVAKIDDGSESERLKKESNALKEFLSDYRKNATELSKLKKELLSNEEGSQSYSIADARVKELEKEQDSIRENIKAYDNYTNTLERIDKLQARINENDKLSEAKYVEKVAKETGKAQEDILNKIAKEREKLDKLVAQEQTSVIDTYEKYAKLVSNAEKKYLTAVINEDENTAQAIEKVIDRYSKLKSDILAQINDRGLDSLFKDRIDNINKDLSLDFNVHAGKVEDKQVKKQYKEDAKALKEYVDEYDRLYKKIIDEQIKVAKYTQKGETVNANAHKENLSRLKEELAQHEQKISSLKRIEKAQEEVNKIKSYHDNTFELGMADVGQKIQTKTYKDFNKLQDKLVARYKELYAEKEKFEKAMSTTVDASAYSKLNTELEKVENQLKEVRSQITSQDHIGKIELFDADRTTTQSREVVQSIGKIRTEAEQLLSTVRELKNSEFVDKSSLSAIETSLMGLANANLDGTVNDLRTMNTELSQTRTLLDQVQSGMNDSIFQSNKNIKLGEINDSIAKFKKDFKGVFDDASFEALEESARRLSKVMDKDSFSQGAKELTAQLKHARNQMDGLVHSSNKYNFFEDLYTNMRTYQLGDLIFDGIQNAMYSVKDIVISLDSAMANVRKVADPIDISTIYKLDEIKSKAIQVSKEVGMASEDVINSIADTIQSGGYRMEEAIEIAKQTMMLANVGEMSAESATKGVVSMLAGFNLNPLKEMQVEVDGVTKKTNELTNAMDMVNHVGNNFAISTEGIINAMQSGGTVLKSYGIGMEETIALITGANKTLQDPNVVK